MSTRNRNAKKSTKSSKSASHHHEDDYASMMKQVQEELVRVQESNRTNETRITQLTTNVDRLSQDLKDKSAEIDQQVVKAQEVKSKMDLAQEEIRRLMIENALMKDLDVAARQAVEEAKQKRAAKRKQASPSSEEGKEGLSEKPKKPKQPKKDVAASPANGINVKPTVGKPPKFCALESIEMVDGQEVLCFRVGSKKQELKKYTRKAIPKYYKDDVAKAEALRAQASIPLPALEEAALKGLLLAAESARQDAPSSSSDVLQKEPDKGEEKSSSSSSSSASSSSSSSASSSVSSVGDIQMMDKEDDKDQDQLEENSVKPSSQSSSFACKQVDTEVAMNVEEDSTEAKLPLSSSSSPSTVSQKPKERDTAKERDTTFDGIADNSANTCANCNASDDDETLTIYEGSAFPEYKGQMLCEVCGDEE